MERLNDTASLAEVIERVNALTDVANAIQIRDRGPRSTRAMTRIDAWRAIHGDLKGVNHKDTAEALGLSYGQIYSARGTYTFKDIKRDEFVAADVVKLVQTEAQ